MKITINNSSIDTKTATLKELRKVVEEIDEVYIRISKALDKKDLVSDNKNKLVLQQIRLNKAKVECNKSINLLVSKERAQKKLKKKENSKPYWRFLEDDIKKSKKKKSKSSVTYGSCYTHNSVKAIYSAVGTKR